MKVNWSSVVALPFLLIGFILQGYYDSEWSYFFYVIVAFILIMTLNDNNAEEHKKEDKSQGEVTSPSKNSLNEVGHPDINKGCANIIKGLKHHNVRVYCGDIIDYNKMLCKSCSSKSEEAKK